MITIRFEAMVWDKELEVDRQRDRWPFSWIVPRVRDFNAIPENQARDFVASVMVNLIPLSDVRSGLGKSRG